MGEGRIGVDSRGGEREEILVEQLGEGRRREEDCCKSNLSLLVINLSKRKISAGALSHKGKGYGFSG